MSEEKQSYRETVLFWTSDVVRKMNVDGSHVELLKPEGRTVSRYEVFHAGRQGLILIGRVGRNPERNGWYAGFKSRIGVFPTMREAVGFLAKAFRSNGSGISTL